MTNLTGTRAYNIIAIACAAWFLLTGAVWVYFFSLIVSYPIAAVGLYFWYKARRNGSNDNWNKTALALLTAGLVISLTVLAGLLITN